MFDSIEIYPSMASVKSSRDWTVYFMQNKLDAVIRTSSLSKWIHRNVTFSDEVKAKLKAKGCFLCGGFLDDGMHLIDSEPYCFSCLCNFVHEELICTDLNGVSFSVADIKMQF